MLLDNSMQMFSEHVKFLHIEKKIVYHSQSGLIQLAQTQVSQLQLQLQ